MEEERTPIDINVYTKGLVYAVPTVSDLSMVSDWLIVIAKTEKRSDEHRNIYRYASIRLKDSIKRSAIPPTKIPILWGNTRNYNFYAATQEQKQQMRKYLLDNNLKYVKVINKLIER